MLGLQQGSPRRGFITSDNNGNTAQALKARNVSLHFPSSQVSFGARALSSRHDPISHPGYRPAGVLRRSVGPESSSPDVTGRRYHRERRKTHRSLGGDKGHRQPHLDSGQICSALAISFRSRPLHERKERSLLL